jgi:hypothetical protein
MVNVMQVQFQAVRDVQCTCKCQKYCLQVEKVAQPSTFKYFEYMRDAMYK